MGIEKRLEEASRFLGYPEDGLSVGPLAADALSAICTLKSKLSRAEAAAATRPADADQAEVERLTRERDEARTAADHYCRQGRDLRVDIAKMREVLHCLEWTGVTNEGRGAERSCIVCDWPRSEGHDPNCSLAAALHTPATGQDGAAKAERPKSDLTRVRSALKSLHDIAADRVGLNDGPAWDALEEAHSAWLWSGSGTEQDGTTNGQGQAYEAVTKIDMVDPARDGEVDRC